MNQKKDEQFDLVAKTFYGFEQLLADEIKLLGGTDVEPGRRMVKFKGGLAVLYKANIYLRTSLRILKNLHSFTITSQDDYYNGLRNIEWENYLGLHHSFAIDSVVFSEIFKNSLFAAQRAKDAIVDRFRTKYAKRPLVDTENPDVLINVHISDNIVTISLDSSGASLHRRGYRTAEGAAPINQVLAAALIKLSGWDYNTPLYDPMTGSGTIAIEAALMARNIPPGLIRKDFCFQNWPDYNKTLYRQLLEEVQLADTKPQIYANDISADVLEIARQNASKANISSFIRFTNKPFGEIKPVSGPGTVIINPPYGERMKEKEINALYSDIGSTLKNKFGGFNAWIISSNANAMKEIGLKPFKKFKVLNGSLECTYSGFELFAGNYKEFKTSRL
ncbi:MAG: RNA methyltransferase [Bacteroidales bacterium]|nr:RNA methyltransferase [Bacteroidales bacterium]